MVIPGHSLDGLLVSHKSRPYDAAALRLTGGQQHLMLVSRSLYGDAGRLLGEDLRAVAGPRAAPQPPRASRTALAPAAAPAYTITSRISTWPTFDSPAP